MLAGCLIFQLIAVWVPKTAAAALTGNLVENAGFENTSGIAPEKWAVYGNVWNESMKAVPEAARTDLYGVSIQTAINNSPWVATSVPVEEGATYDVTSWFRATLDSGNVCYKVEFYKGPEKTAENWVEGFVHAEPQSKLDGQWHEMKYEIQAPSASRYMYVYLRLCGTGTVHFDDVSVVKTKDKQQLVLGTNHVYYYPEMSEGLVKIALEPGDGVYAGKKVDLSIRDEDEGTLFHQAGIAAASELNASFDPLSMELRKPYFVTAVLKDENGLELERQEKTIYRWERPAAIPQNGPVIENGEPFFPFIAYHVERTDFAELSAIGVNTVQGVVSSNLDSMQSWFDSAHANGLKVLVPLYKDMKVKENYDLTERVVNRFKSHPAVLGYMIMDEPVGNGIPQQELLDAYKLVRSLDPIHPTYMVEAAPYAYSSTGQATDILVTDRYPYAKDYMQPISIVGDGVRDAVAAVDNAKPIWTILQMFRLPDTVWDYLPTIEQVRNMAYQSLLAGSKGLGFYAYNDPGWKLKESELWPGLVKFKSEVALIADLVTSGSKTDGHAGGDVQWGVYNKGLEQYVIALNVTKSAKTAAIPLPQAGNTVELAYGGQPKQMGSWEEVLNVDLGPEQTLVYRITPYMNGVQQAIGEWEGASELLASQQWKKKSEKLAAELLKVKEELESAQTDGGKTVKKAQKAIDYIDKLREWVTKQTDTELQGKRAQINDLLDFAYSSLLQIVQSMVQLNVQIAGSPLLPGDELALNVTGQNIGDKAIQNAELRIEFPEALGLPPAVKQLGEIVKGQSFAHAENPVIPIAGQPGEYVVKASLTFEYKGTAVQVPAETAFTVSPLLIARLTPDRMDITNAGSYPFALEMTNASGQPLVLELQHASTEGISIDLAPSVVLAGHENKTVQGILTVSETSEDGEYAFAIEASSAGVRHAILPLSVLINTNAVYNGGFEQKASGSASPAGWELRSGVWDRNVSHSGLSSARLNPDPNNSFHVLNTSAAKHIPVEPGTKYTLTGWVKTEATEGSVALGIRQIDAAGNSIVYSWEEAEKSGEWTKVEVTFTARANAAGASVYFKLDQTANGSAWVDDLSLTAITVVLDGKLTPDSIYANQPGNYPFSIELTNSSANPISVDLIGQVPNGIAMTLDSSVALAAKEKKTVTGSVYIPASVTEGVYGIKVEAKVGNVKYVTLPLSITVSTNLVYNGSFEKMGTDGRPDGWYTSAGVRDQAAAHNGQYSVKLSPDANNAWNTINTAPPRGIAVIPGHTYTLMGWVKNSATTGSVALGIRQANENGSSLTYTWTEAAKNSDWTKVQVTVTALPQAKTIWVYFKMDQIANGPAWVDELELIGEGSM